jgi:hypothetical protein
MDTEQTKKLPPGLKPIKPGEHRCGRKKGTPNKTTQSLRDAILAAAAAVGADGKGAGGLVGYLKALAIKRPGLFAPLLSRVLPLEINQKTTEERTVVRYETVEERRAAMIAKGWAPSVLAALEEAMEPKFLRDMREEEEREKMKVVEEVVEESGEGGNGRDD